MHTPSSSRCAASCLSQRQDMITKSRLNHTKGYDHKTVFENTDAHSTFFQVPFLLSLATEASDHISGAAVVRGTSGVFGATSLQLLCIPPYNEGI